ncbi:hypothetical protein AAEX28_12930 [Lentisphaerota bacterium WC36G]|nr:hypothetical protein LJT99_15750 [Lentisphaerae bacterium WC36]
MKKYFSFIILVVSVVSTLLLCGCSAVNFDYIGRTYPEPTENVVYYSLDSKYNRDEFVIFGRAYCVTKPNTSNETIKNEILQLAQEKGADAVKITGSSSRDVAEFSIPKDDKGGSVYDPNIFQYDRGRDVGGDFLTTNSYGTNSKNLSDQKKVIVTEKIFNVIFLKKIKPTFHDKKSQKK